MLVVCLHDKKAFGWFIHYRHPSRTVTTKSAICNVFLTREITGVLKVHFVKFTKQSLHMIVTVVIGRGRNMRTKTIQVSHKLYPVLYRLLNKSEVGAGKQETLTIF